MDDEFIPNPDLYRRLSAPKATFECANDAAKRFFDGIAKLREECGIPDVSVIVEIPHYVDDFKREVAAYATYHLGNQLNKLPMIARAYGAVRSEFDRAIGDIVATYRMANR